MRGFAPDRVRALEADIRAFAAELIDRVATSGQCDFVDAIAEPMPVIIFMKSDGDGYRRGCANFAAGCTTCCPTTMSVAPGRIATSRE